MGKVKFQCTSRKRDTKMKGILLVITYHPLPKEFTSVIRKHLYILCLIKEVKEIFTPGTMVSFQWAKKKWEAILLQLNSAALKGQLDRLM